MWPARSCLIVLISVVLLSWASTGTALTYVSNLAATYDVSLSARPDPNFSTASSFTTGADALTLNSVTLKIQSNEDGNTVGVRLRADQGGQPGSTLELLGEKTLPLGTSLQTFASGGLTLAPNRTYWVTAGETGSGSVSWAGTFSTTETSPAGWTIGDQSFNTNNHVTWNPIEAGPPAESGLFSVDAVPIDCVSNHAETNSVNFSAEPPPNATTASSFTTSSGSSTLHHLVLRLQSNGTGNFVGVRLRADNGGHPGILLEDLGAALLPLGASVQSFTSAGTILAGSTTYWVTAGEIGLGSVSWAGTSSTAEVSPAGWTIGDQSFNTNDGTTWNPISFGPPNESALFTVDASCPGTVDVGGSDLRAQPEISAAIPNPFRAATRIDYTLPTAGHVTVTVHDVRGARVATLRDGEFGAGRYSTTWDGHTEAGGRARAGVYFLRMTLSGAGAADSPVAQRSLVMLR